MHKTIARLVILWFLPLYFSNLVQAATPLAATFIDNQASATYFDTDAGFFSTLYSNIVRATVQPIEAVQVGAAQTIYRTPGSFAVMPYQVTNTGNVSST